MRSILVFIFVFAPIFSFGQKLLGKTQKHIIDAYKNKRDMVITEITDSTLNYSINGEKIMYSFKNNLCIVEGFDFSKETKDYFIVKYVEEGYSVNVNNKEGVLYVSFENNKYLIQMIIAKTPYKETDLYLMFISYLPDEN